MSYIVFRNIARGWQACKSRAAWSGRGSRHSFRPALVALEDRLVLSFAAPVDYVVGTQVTEGGNGFGPHVITGDFHGNGKLDLVVTNTADGTVSILAGNGDGTFQPAVTYDTGLGPNNPDWLAAADFNSDGKLDLAVEGENGEVSIMLGNGNGTFASPVIYSVGAADRGNLAVGDYFGNGRQDIAVAIYSTDTVAILPNNGDGTFGAPISVSMPAGFDTIRSVTTANFFGNGFADLAVAGGQGYNNTILSTDPAGVALFKNDGKGNFTFEGKYLAAVTPDPGGGDGTGDIVNPEGIDAADLTNDGKPDIVISLYDHNIDVFINKGNGIFGPAEAYDTETPKSLGGYPRAVVFGDFNGDGKIDIATLNFGEPVPVDQPTTEPGSVGVLYGNGDGTFQAPVEYTPFVYPGGLAVGDFNRDGLPDLAVTQNYTGHAVGVMLNQPGTAQEPPTVTRITPATGPVIGGTLVTITGTNFTGTSQVDFGSVPAAAFRVNSGQSITATAPAETAGTVDITVYNAGASALNSADEFTYQTYQTPTIASIAVSPASATVADGSTQPFSAVAYDQFGNPLATQPAFTWWVSGLGSINPNGLYSAPASGTGSATVTAESDSQSGTASVTIVSPTDIWTGLGRTNNWSEAANWSLNAVPGPATTALFNGTSDKNANVDVAFGNTVAAVQIGPLYNGKITLYRSLIVAGTFTQAGGTYFANRFATSVGGITTLSGGTYYASTATQTLTDGLNVTGGAFDGSTGTVSTGSVAISSGTLFAPSTNLIVTGGDFTYSGGAFNADNGTVTFTGSHVSPTISVGTGLIRFYNFTDALSAENYPNWMTIVGTLTVTGTFVWKSDANPISGNIEAQGNVDDENHGGIGDPYLILDGSANQTIEDLSGQGGGQFRTISIDKLGGTVSLACNPIVWSGLTVTAGTVNTGSYSWVVAGSLSAAPLLNLGSIEIAGSNVTVSSLTLQVANVTFANAAARFEAPLGQLSVSGNWDDSAGAAFDANLATVVFDGTGTQSLNSGGASFNNLTITLGSTLSLGSNVIVAGIFLDLGTLLANGYKILK